MVVVLDGVLDEVGGRLPVDELPVDELPVDGLPVGGLPVDELPMDELPLDWADSSSASLASSACNVDCADDTDSLRAVVSSVPNVSPAVTDSPGLTATFDTLPPT